MSGLTTVFYVDDDADDQLLFSEAVGEIGKTYGSRLNLFKAENGQEYFDKLSQENVIPDITFLDINMPVKNGFECLSEIRANTRLKKHLVIMLSTSESDEIISRSMALGADKYIVKPPDFKALKKEIENCLYEFNNQR